MLPIFFTVFKEGWDAFYHLRILLASNKWNWAKCWNSIQSHSFLTGVKLFSIVLHIHKVQSNNCTETEPRRAIVTSFINWCHVSSFVLIMMMMIILHKQTIFFTLANDLSMESYLIFAMNGSCNFLPELNEVGLSHLVTLTFLLNLENVCNLNSFSFANRRYFSI